MISFIWHSAISKTIGIETRSMVINGKREGEGEGGGGREREREVIFKGTAGRSIWR